MHLNKFQVKEILSEFNKFVIKGRCVVNLKFPCTCDK